MNAAHGVDGAKGERYLASPQRRAFMLALAKRQNAVAARSAGNALGSRGKHIGEKYSVTRESMRSAVRPLLA